MTCEVKKHTDKFGVSVITYNEKCVTHSNCTSDTLSAIVIDVRSSCRCDVVFILVAGVQ